MTQNDLFSPEIDFGVFKEYFNLSWRRSTHSGWLYSIPNIHVEVMSSGPLRVFALASEVISYSKSLNLGTIGFLLFSATRSFFPRAALTPSGAERLGV